MIDSRLSGFYKLKVPARIARLQDVGCIDAADAGRLLAGEHVLGVAAADKMIENAIGVFALPLAIAPNFIVNSRETIVPLAVEEPSIVAGLSGAAALARNSGGFTARADESLLAAQLHIVGLEDAGGAARSLASAKRELLREANRVHPRLVERGGGVRDIEIRELALRDRMPLIVLHVLVDTCDAMGANLVNTIAETLASRVATISGGDVVLKILSNLTDRSIATATVRFAAETLADAGMSGEEVRDRIVLCNEIACVDPHRAATHNKGIFNGIDALAIATGNDWRAIEAGGHAYAARSGQYSSLTEWKAGEAGELVGEIALPLKPGTVGGTLGTNPGAALGLAICGVAGSRQLAELMAAVGLAQNFAAIRALATRGIQRGHMRLHARSLANAAGATEAHIDAVVERLVDSGEFNVSRARSIVAGITAKPSPRLPATASAAGKVILLGEHAVVYGRHALAVPVPDAIRATAVETTGKSILSVDEWEFSIDIGTGDDKAAAIVRLILKKLDAADRCFDIRASSLIPRGVGLGSSSAIAVAITRAVASAVGLDLSTEDVNSIAFECEKIAHGDPSGIDNTLSSYAVPMLFRRGAALQDSLLAARRSPPLVLGFAHGIGHTAEMVAGVRRKVDQDKDVYNAVFDQIDALSIKGADALLAEDHAALGRMMNVCQGLLNAIGVSTPELERMIRIARDAGAEGAKLTGAGGGGAIVALGPGREEAVAGALADSGFQTLVIGEGKEV